MMGRWLIPVAVLVPFVMIGPAIAGEHGPVCRQPSVTDEITREVRDQDYYSFVNPDLVSETATADANVVRCQVCVQSAPYTVTRFGERMVRQCLEHSFEVRVLHGGFVVRDLK